ncbi:hypothetical protein SESBI_15777 [Sesbania bispinosa]|nr:hypothetical protein SESBI_15777 [Sesbania bispinosa]
MGLGVRAQNKIEKIAGEGEREKATTACSAGQRRYCHECGRCATTEQQRASRRRGAMIREVRTFTPPRRWLWPMVVRQEGARRHKGQRLNAVLLSTWDSAVKVEAMPNCLWSPTTRVLHRPLLLCHIPLRGLMGASFMSSLPKLTDLNGCEPWELLGAE